MSQGTEATGHVYDLGFRRYEGPREGRRRAILAVYKNGMRTALGLGRGGRAKVVPWLFVSAALIPAVVMALIAGAVDRLAPGFNAATDLPSHADYYSIGSIVLLIFAAVIGPELYCPDRKNGTISLYLVRPFKATDYAFSRWAALLTVMLASAWLPQIVLLAGLVLGAPSPTSYFGDHWLDVPRFLLAGAALALYYSTIAAFVGAYAARRTYAAAFMVGAFVVSGAVIGSITDVISRSTGHWVALLSLLKLPVYMNDLIFPDRTSLDLPAAIQVGWFLLLILVAALLTWTRYRRIAA